MTATATVTVPDPVTVQVTATVPATVARTNKVKVSMNGFIMVNLIIRHHLFGAGAASWHTDGLSCGSGYGDGTGMCDCAGDSVCDCDGDGKGF